MTLGEKIQTLRKQRNISQEQLAEHMNVTRQAVSKWELSESVPDVENIVRLSGILDVSTDYLLKDPPVPSVQTPQATTWPPKDHESFYDGEEDEDEFQMRGRFRLEFSNAIYPVAVLVYLFLGFRYSLWHPGWIVFVVAWFIEEIVDFVKTGKFHISVYGVAGVAFLVLGFVFGWWSYAWMVFVLAWVIDEVVVRDKPKKKKKRKQHDIDYRD